MVSFLEELELTCRAAVAPWKSFESRSWIVPCSWTRSAHRLDPGKFCTFLGTASSKDSVMSLCRGMTVAHCMWTIYIIARHCLHGALRGAHFCSERRPGMGRDQLEFEGMGLT